MVQKNGTATFIKAGHCSPIRVSRDGAFEYLDTTSMPVGMMDDTEFLAEVRQLQPGDKLVVYSDGVTEAATPNDEEFEIENLAKTLAANANQSALTMIEEVNKALTAWTEGAPPADDITLIVARLLP